jgi:stress response protein SCP2
MDKRQPLDCTPFPAPGDEPSKKQMTPERNNPINPINNTAGGAAGVVITLLLLLAVAAGGGYWAYVKYYKVEPPRTKLSSLKVKEELVQFTHDRVSHALHHNMITLDGIVVMMDKELKRLKRIGKKFPDQKAITDTQIEELTAARKNLSVSLKKVTAKLEKIYVTWLVDRSEGTGQIQSQKGTLTRILADAIRGESVLIGRIRSNPLAAS